VVDLLSRIVVFPDGDTQEIEHDLSVNQLVDVNGVPLELPLPTARMIAYRVFRKGTSVERHEETVRYHLELVPAAELVQYTLRRGGSTARP
jgi:hypothetical protein